MHDKLDLIKTSGGQRKAWQRRALGCFALKCKKKSSFRWNFSLQRSSLSLQCRTATNNMPTSKITNASKSSMFSTTMLWKSSYPMLNAHDQSRADINADMQALCNMGILAIPLMLQSQSYLKSPLTPLEVPSSFDNTATQHFENSDGTWESKVKVCILPQLCAFIVSVVSCFIFHVSHCMEILCVHKFCTQLSSINQPDKTTATVQEVIVKVCILRLAPGLSGLCHV